MEVSGLPLPPELVQEICSHFQRGENDVDYAPDWASTQRDLAALCRVSKRFNDLVKP